MDWLDELLAPLLSSNPNARANRRRIVFAVISTAFTLWLWFEYIEPIDTQAFQPDDGPDIPNGLIVAAFLSPVVVWFASGSRAPLWRCLLGAVIVPLAVGYAAVTVQDERDAQREALAIFERYTERFPAGRMGSPDVREQTLTTQLTVCATESGEGEYFCLELGIDEDTGQEVYGGYRYRDSETTVLEGRETIIEPFDCFGETTECPSD